MSATQESAPAAVDPPDETGPRRTGIVDVARRFRGPLLLLLAAVLLVALSGWFLAQSLHARSAATNHALIDRNATSQVIGDVSDGLDRIFSYSYADTEATQQAAATVLTGQAAGQYTTLFSQVRRSASAQQLKLTTRVVSIGVTRLDDAHAQLLVFLDQSATRGDTGQTSTSAAQLSISARLIAGRWIIDNIHAR